MARPLSFVSYCIAPSMSSPLNDVSLPSGGVILRSSDAVEFKVYENILALASPVFKDMFSLPQAPQTSSDASSESGQADGLPVVDLSEKSATLDMLLRIIYPVVPPAFKGVSSNGTVTDAAQLIKCVEPVLEAALKYDMRIVVKQLCSKLLDASNQVRPDGTVVDDTLAVRVYVPACRFRLRDEACIAASAALRGRVRGVFCDGLRSINAAHYFRLLEYHEKAVNAVLPLFRLQNVPKEHRDIMGCGRCDKVNGRSGKEVARCWLNFFEEAEVTVRQSPRSCEILSNKFMEDSHELARNCVNNTYRYDSFASNCARFVLNFEPFSQYLREAMEVAVTQVCSSPYSPLLLHNYDHMPMID